jgi:hypothetical protein
MVNAPSMQGNSSRKLDRFHVHLLLVLGIVFLGAGITVIGLATTSATTVGIGAGAIAAAGLLSIVFAVLGFGLDVNQDAEIIAESTNSTPPLAHDPFGGNPRPLWPPKTAAPLQYEGRWRS